jgi:MFS family permease
MAATDTPPSTANHGKNFTTDYVETTRSRAELAAAYTEMERNLTFFQTVKIYWRSCLWCAYAMLIILNFGIDGIIAGAAISVPKFCEDYGKPAGEINGFTIWVIPAVWISIFGAVSQATSVIGALICGYIADQIGRRNTNALSCLISFGGVAAQYWSNGSLGVLVAGKGINGVAIGMWLVLAPTYVSEVAPLRIRGVLSAMVNTILFSGVFLFTGVMYVLAARTDTSSYLVPFACQWIIPCLVLLTFWLWPESLVWLARIGKREKAFKAIEQIHGKTSPIDKAGLLAQIEETLAMELAMKQSGEESYGFAECFNKSNCVRTFATMFVYTCQYLSGNTLVIGYQTYYYRLVIGWGPSKAFAVTLGSTAFYWACNVIAWCFVAKLRRRPLIVYACSSWVAFPRLVA